MSRRSKQGAPAFCFDPEPALVTQGHSYGAFAMENIYTPTSEIQERETLITQAAKAWRSVLPVHPAAEIIPEYTEEKKIELGRLIKTAGRMNVPVIVFLDPASGKLSLGDGRSRLDALIAVGIKFSIKVTSDTKVTIVAQGIEIPEPQIIPIADSFDPYAFVAATNVGRRHLNAAKKQEVAAKLLIARPELADRAIAKLAGVDHKTVAAIRKKILANGGTPHNAERVEETGRKARGRKPGQTNVKAMPVTEAPAAPDAAWTSNDASPAGAPDAPASSPSGVEVAAVPLDHRLRLERALGRDDAAHAEIAKLARHAMALLTHAEHNKPDIQKRLARIINIADPDKRILRNKTPATSNTKLDLGAFERVVGHA
jgi:hypothetical protein